MISSGQIHICDVCRLLDFDTSKKLCSYCNLCDAFICEQDQSKWGRRLLAAAKRKLEPNFLGQNDYVEKMQEQLNAQGGRNDTSTDS